jgi:hypothetical protein
MKLKINKLVEIDVIYLSVKAGVRYWEDAVVNDVEDVDGNLIPCRNDDYWCPIIEIETGKILNWKLGVTANIHYKVCDDGYYYLLDKSQNLELGKEGYVLDCLSIESQGFGDYITIKVDENGFIRNWKFSQKDLENDFINED